jgi:hypothetical protein
LNKDSQPSDFSSDVRSVAGGGDEGRVANLVEPANFYTLMKGLG